MSWRSKRRGQLSLAEDSFSGVSVRCALTGISIM